MSRQLQIISAQPNDKYFIWQLQVQLANFRKLGYSNKYTILIWKHSDRVNNEDFDKEWKVLEARYPEAKFVYYTDTTGVLKQMINKYNYIPLLRPWLLGKYFAENPSLKNDAILYLDSDVIFTKKLDIDKYLDDDVCYLSDTQSYIAASYFDSKLKDVLPEKVEVYKQIDVLDVLLKEFGLDRQVAVDNEKGSGGAQYLLKNIDSQFWEDVFKGCIITRINLHSVNRRFFENEDKGFQVWAADMWSVLFNLWKRGYKTECPREMDFAWATDYIEKWDQVSIYHDAGASPTSIKYKDETQHKLFHKRDSAYINNVRTPFEDDLSFVSDKYCSYNYVQQIKEAK